MNQGSAAQVLSDETRHVLDALPERVVVCGPNGDVQFVNRAAQALLGWSGEELRGRNIDIVLPARYQSVAGRPLLDHLLSLPEGQSLHGAIAHRHGVEIEVDFGIALLARDQRADCVVLVMRQLHEKDTLAPLGIEDRVRTETYRLVFDGAPVGIFHFDDRGVITACNDAFVRIIGSSKRVLVGLNMTTLPFRPIAHAVQRTLLGEPSRFEGDYPSATAKKTTRVRVDFAPILNDRGRTVGGVGIAEDVTERVHAEEAQRRAIQSLRTLIENAPDAISVHRNNRFLLVNPALVHMFGYDSAEAVIATPVLDLVHEADRAITVTRLAELASGIGAPSHELRMVRKDGTTILAENASMPVHFDDMPAILTLTRDITERKRLETRLTQADRMASIGTLAAGIAHEINNPLTYVMVNLDLLGRTLTGKTSVAAVQGHTPTKMVDAAREGCDRVCRIVRDLRTFSRVGAERRDPVDLITVIDSAINVAELEIRHRAQVVRDLEPVPELTGDPARLGQVVLNLLVNAAQAIEPGNPSGHCIRIATRRQSGWVELTVQDDGVGMTADVLSRLFEPFFTTKPTGEGTGLGLSICLGIVQSHGGAISVASEPGKGSTFTVLLPIRTFDQAEPSPEARLANGTIPPSRIFIIDDEVQLGVALRESLARHEVRLATSGREGLELLLGPGSPDLILCDLMMPDVSGLAVFEALRRERPDLCSRFVFMTGGAFPEQAIEFLAGPNALRLHKPFDTPAVEQLLRAVIARNEPDQGSLG